MTGLSITNRHVEHLEDLMVLDPYNGYQDTIDIIECLLAGQSQDLQVTMKYDGSPAIFWGHDSCGDPFVATKSIFNKKPKINRSFTEIWNNHGMHSGLSFKLIECLVALPQVKNSTIYQGDLLFINNLLIDDASSFQPNIIRYTPIDDKLITKIANAPLGIAVHTKYINGNRSPITQDDLSDLARANNCGAFVLDCLIDHQQFTHQVQRIQHTIKALQSNLIVHRQQANIDIELLKVLGEAIVQFTNRQIVLGGQRSFDELALFLRDKKKMSLPPTAEKDINTLFACQNEIRRITKAFCIAMTNTQMLFKHSINGHESCGPEGLMLWHKNRYVKIVDRETFSRACLAMSMERYVA